MKSSNVTVRVNNQTVGTLYPVRAGIVFRYADEWLSSDTAYELFPQLSLSPTSYSFKGIGPFTDSAPDRWGRMLLRHADNTRSLSELDYLLGVNGTSLAGRLLLFHFLKKLISRFLPTNLYPSQHPQVNRALSF